MSSVDPRLLFEQLTKGKVHPRKTAGLAIVHEICKQRFDAKATDWRISSIGRESEARGGTGAASLHQPRQADYRALIKAWQGYAEAAHPAVKTRSPSSKDDWIYAIDNLSSRQMVLALKGELVRALDEVKLLKKLLPNGGVLEVPRAIASQPQSDKPSVAVTASAERSIKRFVEGPLQNQRQLADMGLRLSKKGDLAAESTGEVVIEAEALDFLRAAAKLS